jgi:hypothetical protein
MSQTLTYTKQLVTEECCNCGVTFAMPVDLRNQLLNDPSRWFYCPNGHRQHYTGKTEAQKAAELAERYRVQRDNMTRQLAEADQRLADAKRKHAATKGQLTRAVKRSEKGVCLHCNRHFVNVEKHMRGQHQDQMETPV